jgi:hypothetical protein
VSEALFKLSDADWNKMMGLAGLPSHAREQVESLFSVYKQFRAVGSRAETADNLLSIEKHANALRQLIQEKSTALFYAYAAANEPPAAWSDSFAEHVLAADSAIRELQPYRITSTSPGIELAGDGMERRRHESVTGPGTARLRTHSALQEYTDMLSALLSWTDRALIGLPKEHRSPEKDPENTRWLLSELDRIVFHFTSQHINRSKKTGLLAFWNMVGIVLHGDKPDGWNEALRKHVSETP